MLWGPCGVLALNSSWPCLIKSPTNCTVTLASIVYMFYLFGVGSLRILGHCGSRARWGRVLGVKPLVFGMQAILLLEPYPWPSLKLYFGRNAQKNNTFTFVTFLKILIKYWYFSGSFTEYWKSEEVLGKSSASETAYFSCDYLKRYLLIVLIGVIDIIQVIWIQF